MKIFSIILFFLMFGTNSLLSQTSIIWNKNLHQFGSVLLEEKLSVDFEFKNLGEDPLIVNEVHPGCGCTSFDYTKTPILPGLTGYIKVEYTPKSLGSFHKNVTVDFNNLDPQILYIQGVVKEKN